jgi:hypothetical protein
MAKITVQQISRKAKQIRHKGEKWTNAIKRASKELKKKHSGTVGAKTPGPGRSSRAKSVPRKKSSYKPRKPIHQTGTSSKKIDKRIKAKAPGKRRVKSGKGSHYYYEYRKNRSDMPGQMTGLSRKVDGSAYREMILGRMREIELKRSNAEREILELMQQKRNTPTKEKLKRKFITKAITDRKKFVATCKKEISMLKALYR